MRADSRRAGAQLAAQQQKRLILRAYQLVFACSRDLCELRHLCDLRDLCDLCDLRSASAATCSPQTSLRAEHKLCSLQTSLQAARVA